MQDILMKKCSNKNCHQIKSITKFSKNKNKKDGYSDWCKICTKQYNKTYHIQHQKDNNIRSKQWDIHNPQRKQQNMKQWTQLHPHYNTIYKNKKRNIDPKFKHLTNLRAYINRILNGYIKSKHSIDLLGHSIQEDKQFIELQFYTSKLYGEMTWNKRGKGIGHWQIHHICPLEFFDLSDPVEQKQAFHYSNTKPLWYEDHIEEHKNINKRMKFTV